MEDLIYFAGLFDGEGSVGFRGNGDNTKIFTMEIRMTDEFVINWVIETFGGTHYFIKSKNPKHKDQWRWRVKGKSAKTLYLKVKPYLKIKNTFSF